MQQSWAACGGALVVLRRGRCSLTPPPCVRRRRVRTPTSMNASAEPPPPPPSLVCTRTRDPPLIPLLADRYIVCGQPMMINGGTGPVLAFTGVLYQISISLDVPFLTFNAWVGLWVGLYMLLAALVDLNRFMLWATRFTVISAARLERAGQTVACPLLSLSSCC